MTPPKEPRMMPVRRILAAVSWTALGSLAVLVALAFAQTPAPVAPAPVAPAPVAPDTPWAAIAQIVATIMGAIVTGFLAYLARSDAREAKKEATQAKAESVGAKEEAHASRKDSSDAKDAAVTSKAEAERLGRTADTISTRVDEYHKSVNSKMDKLLQATDEAAELRGILKERERAALVLAETAAIVLKEKGAADAASVLDTARIALAKEGARLATEQDLAAHIPPIKKTPEP